MSRKSGKVPSYCQHKASGRAVVRINGRDHYLGKFGSPESHAEYERLISKWRSTRLSETTEAIASAACREPSLTVAEALLRYHAFARVYYSKDGQPTKEFVEMGLALRPLRELLSTTLAREFGPLRLDAVRQNMIEAGLSRGVINNRIHRIKRCFRWLVSQQLIPATVYEGLRTVDGLKRGRSKAKELPPVSPVDDAYVDAVLPHVVPQVAAMVQLQRLTGMRPCEVGSLRQAEIDMTRDIWVYEPAEHKNAWRGHDRKIPIGPRAQQVLSPFLKSDAGAYLFSPRDAAEHRRVTRRAARKSPMTPSQRKRGRVPAPTRPLRDHYDVDSYRRSIKYGIRKVNKLRLAANQDSIPEWFPLQLRHSRATELNELYGIEAAAVSLGHAHADVTKVYAERNLKLAIEVARKTG